MPIYTYRCVRCGVTTEQVHAVKELHCTDYYCWCTLEKMALVIHAPLLVKVAADVCYDSPIDGRPITSWAAREEDLKRNQCRPYDPMQKQDYDNRIKREDEALDQAVHATVEEAVEKMPTAQRAKLASELLDKGAGIEYARGGQEG